MRLWNLNSIDDLQPQVVQESTPLQFGRIEARRGASNRTSPVKMAFRVAALTVASLAVTVVGSDSNCYIATGTAVVADNTEQGKPPLSSIFANRFDAQWTAEHEQALLAKMVKKKASHDADDELLDFMDS